MRAATRHSGPPFAASSASLGTAGAAGSADAAEGIDDWQLQSGIVEPLQQRGNGGAALAPSCRAPARQ
jgi:hypothetical protein